ncbi:hypothetical protein [Labrenzia sp. PHM005]|uniref:hypothetical protein n=1 Tax=Labrenzia sp. PHM005 TaxID=2590016 RepID=UPI00143DD3B8|nr:hypothetical protein [Labrenzia sp. PHM005]
MTFWAIELVLSYQRHQQNLLSALRVVQLVKQTNQLHRILDTQIDVTGLRVVHTIS